MRGLREHWWVAGATAVSLAVAGWWTTADDRVPDFDSGQHLLDIFTVRYQLVSGQLTAPFTDWNNYPPLGHIVGAVGTLIGGINVPSVLMSENIVFVSLLAAGCYGAGKIAGGPRAGLLAALFALGTPIVVSQMHEVYLDLPETAMVAVSVWAILASRRFERIWVSALAGFVCSIGMLSKQTFPLFIVGFLAIVIVRGGWRRWRGIAMFILGGAGLTLPWYVYHYAELRGLTSGATATGAGAAAAGAGVNAPNGITPSRFTSSNFGWYVWNLLNHQLLVPLALFLLVGIVLAVSRFARNRDSEDVLPELIGGGAFGYLAMTYLTLKDPRYTLPALVYMAVLGTSWLPRVRPRLRPWLTGAFGIVVLANFIAVSFGFGPTLQIVFPGAPNPSTAEARVLTFYSPNGWVRGGPVHEGDVLGLMQGLRRLGVVELEVDGGSANSPDFNNAGLSALAIVAGLAVPGAEDLSAMGPTDAFVLRRVPMTTDPPACQMLDDGTGIYVSLGNPLMFPFDETTFVCPGAVHPFYHVAPTPGLIPQPERTELLSVLRAMRRHGIRTVQFDATTMQLPPYDRIGLEGLAAQAGLSVPPRYGLPLGPEDAFMLRVPQASEKKGAPPCKRLPDGSGLYVVLSGSRHVPSRLRELYCPLTPPHRSHTSPAGG
jgi:hypothetical protein